MGSSLMGSVSTDSDPKTQKLIDIMDGGENFVARMKMLTDQEKASNAADAKLRASQDMRGTLDAATDRLAKAEKTLVEARAKATEIMTQAREYAERVTTEAQARVGQMNAQATQLREEAKSLVKDKLDAIEAGKAEAQRLRDEAVTQAKAMRDEAAALHAAAKQKEADVAHKREDLDKEHDEVGELRLELQRRLRMLTEAVARAGA